MSKQRGSASPLDDDSVQRAGGWLRRMLALPNDDRRKILLVAVALCLLCSLLVSLAAVALRPLQEANALFDLRRNLLVAAGLTAPDASHEAVRTAFEKVEVRLVDLRTGTFSEEHDPLRFDARAAANNAALSGAIPAASDMARIRRRSHFSPVYLIQRDDALKQVILPVHGYGLWSTMYGFVALGPDLRTITGLRFYEHEETAGLGAEIDNPRWLARWPGTVAIDDGATPIVQVVKGRASQAGDAARSQVDGLAGATLTADGVEALLHYWLGEQGFGPFLASLREEAGA